MKMIGGRGERSLGFDGELERAIVRTMADGFCVVRAEDRRIVHASTKLARMFGYAPGELEDQPLSVLYDGCERVSTRADELLERLGRYGEAVVETCNQRKDGTPFWCTVHASTFEAEGQGPLWVLLHTDVTEKKKLEEVRRVSEERFKRLMNSGIIGIVIADVEGRILEANDYFLRLVGFTRDELAREKVRWDR